MTAFVETHDLALSAPGGRPLFAGLSLRLERGRVALVGRNGVGKSTLLGALSAGEDPRIVTRGRVHVVPQLLSEMGRSHGEARRAALEAARTSGADILLLDEPTEDLDDAGASWMRAWLRRWEGCAIVATHDRGLLEDFEHFFVVSEAGCRYLHGDVGTLEDLLEREHLAHERRYARELARLAAAEERADHVARRKARKKRYGRCSELDRATPRVRLNAKRGQAQVSHGRFARVQAERLATLRTLATASRRALRVELTPELVVPTSLPEAARERVAVVGPNGAGKSTLLRELALSGDASRVGYVAQGGANWLRDETLAELLGDPAVLVAHRFPLALAARPLRSLSPGERARAALLVLLASAPPIDTLVLDEPTFSLDLVGRRALTAALRAWPGGLVVASHDHAFLDALALPRVAAIRGPLR